VRHDHQWIRELRERGYTWDLVTTCVAEGDYRPTTQQLMDAHYRWKKRGGPGRSRDRTRTGGGAPNLGGSVTTSRLPGPPGLLNPRPFDVTYPTLSAPEDAEVVTGVIYGDTHGQYIDDRAEAVLLSVLEHFEPDVVVHVGDGVDCYTISTFDKDPHRKESFQDEVDASRTHLARARAAAPSAAFYLLEGNHEARLRKSIWKSMGSMREIAKLRAFQESITWPHLLQLEQLGIQWIPEEEQPLRGVFPKFLLKHGTLVRKWSGYSARGEWEKYGKSGASGHVHRLGMFFHRDWNGNHVWVETGCLCDLDPDYTRDPDWQQGFIVASFHRPTGAFSLEPVYIHNGSALWRGRRFTS
jgi:predicted phosphodiesterase